ncbi:MAG: lysine--tRNA ligase [Victivallales bacterium]|jgi:lysyl-tRNA synthetase class 2|nr:lysine--tRNA ligase [Victivallales bacterium]
MSDENQNNFSEPEMNSLMQQRMIKVEELRQAGIDPFGHAFADTQMISVVRENATPTAEGEVGENVTVAGRLMAKRGMGKSIFADIKDSSGRIQLFVGKSEIGDDEFAMFKKLDIGDIIGISGPTFITRMGELTIRVKQCTLLSKSLRPLPEKFHGLQDVEQRYRQRYLDLITNEESFRVLQLRSRILAEIRNFMNERGFMEVETPMLQPLAGGAAANPFKTYYEALSSEMYMRIAPELYLKRLLVGGFEKVYELNRNFRNEGMDRRHNPEFTMMEVYQAYGDCRTMMELIESLVTTVAIKTVGTLKIDHGNGKIIDLTLPWRRATYNELCEEKGGKDWFSITPAERIERGRKMGLDIPEGMSDLDVTNELYEKMVEPTLIQPTFVCRLPVELLPLAKGCPDDPAYVDVFELGINGVEVAPAYSELNDPILQRKRFMEQFEKSKQPGDKVEDKVDEEFLTALEYGMPPAGGMGIGIDRLVMILTGAETIRDVLLFPQMRLKRQQ